jgi:hypothetical protein
VASIILTSVVFSVLAARREQSTANDAGHEADSP